MPDPKRPRKRLLATAAVATFIVAGPVVTVVFGLGGISALAAYMDLHGFTTAVRVAVVGAVAVVVVPLGWAVGGALCGRIEAKADRRQLASLRRGDIAAHTQSSSPARHRKVA